MSNLRLAVVGFATLIFLSIGCSSLLEDSNKIGQEGYYKLFEACVVKVIGAEGGYGPTGKYKNEITVSKICV
jgi:hypothetical protein